MISASTLPSCPLCQKVFKGIKGLNNHIRHVDCQRSKQSQRSQNETKTEAFQCDKCPVICSSKKSLKIHARTAHLEEGEKALPFRCTPCGKSFLKQSYYEVYTIYRSHFAWVVNHFISQEHQYRFHTDIKPFPCMYCPKRCATKQDLDRFRLF